jgi:hypothetical protein
MLVMAPARYLRPGLNEPEDVVHQQQHVPVLVVAEVFRHCQRCMAHAEARARRLVHLGEHHHHGRQHASVLHLAIELLALPRALADAAEDTDALLVPDHVVDHLGQQHRLADAGAAEQARLAAALQWREHIDHLDAGLEHLRRRGPPRQRRRLLMDRAPLHAGERRFAVDGVAKDVEHPSKDLLAHRGLQRATSVLHLHAARQPLRRRQCDTAHMVGVALRQHLDHDATVVARTQQRIDRRQAPVEADVDDTSTHGDDRADVGVTLGCKRGSGARAGVG